MKTVNNRKAKQTNCNTKFFRNSGGGNRFCYLPLKTYAFLIPSICPLGCVEFLNFRLAFLWSPDDFHSCVPYDQLQCGEPRRRLSRCPCLWWGNKTLSQHPPHMAPWASSGRAPAFPEFSAHSSKPGLSAGQCWGLSALGPVVVFSHFHTSQWEWKRQAKC